MRAQALRGTLQALGGFFAWPDDEPKFVPLAEALQEEALTQRFAATGVRLAEASGLPGPQVDPRVAVSATQVGLVSRIWSLALGSALLHSWVPDLRPATLRCDPEPSAAWRLALAGTTADGVPAGPGGDAVTAGPAGDAVTAGQAAEAIRRSALPTVAWVSETCATVGRTSPRVLVSNAASSLVGAGTVLTRQRPDVGRAADEVVAALLRDRWLAAGGRTVDEDGGFKRSGCCLYYRLPAHGLCPDCVLVRPGHPADDHH